MFSHQGSTTNQLAVLSLLLFIVLHLFVEALNHSKDMAVTKPPQDVEKVNHGLDLVGLDNVQTYDDQNLKPNDGQEEVQHTTLQRGLKARHITMIAIGGAIGTGLIIGTGKSLA